MSASLPCIICTGEVNLAWSDDPEGEYAQPSGATWFWSHGNYGSTVWDPGGLAERVRLRVNICDRCLLDAAAKGLVEHRTTIPEPDRYESVRWDGDGLVYCGRCHRAVRSPHDKHDDEEGSPVLP